MSNYPNQIDSDVELPIVSDNITEIGGVAINALRDAVFNIEQEVGLGGSGTSGTIADRLGVSILPNGNINPSALTGLGLVTIPITNSQISNTAAIPESKLALTHSTQDLFNFITDLSLDVNASNGWISSTGIKLDPHLAGVIYRHILSHIDVSTDTSLYLKNKFETLRNNSNSYTLINDINNELLFHQFADGYLSGFIQNVTTNNGSTYPSNYAHTASGLFLNTDRFSTIPQTAQDLQSFAQFIDDSSIFLYGTRIQNLYSNGISKVSRSSSLSTDGYGAPIVPVTAVIAYLLNNGTNSTPFDDINTGDDIIEFKPATNVLTSNSFDEQFSLVRVGDIIRINYGTIEVGFVIKEKKYIQNGGNKKFIIRIAGKNLSYSTTAVARIDRPLVNSNKFGVLAIAAANNEFSVTPSLIVGSPSGAQTLGNGFKPDQLNNTHFLLHLALYPTGNVTDGYTILPGIDVTGNAGITPGQYTLNTVVEATNNALRRAGYNYRFIAYSFQGNFGIMLADSYHNAGFSIINAVVNDNGQYDQTETNINFPNNVIDVFENADGTVIDPLGFGLTGSNTASPLYQSTYASPESSIIATKLFVPLKRNNYYVNGAERDKLNLDIGQLLDGYGDGYWAGSVISQNIFPGPTPVGRVETTYRIMLDLSASNLKVGKTLVVQGTNSLGIVNFGRFIIQALNFSCSPNDYTDITVFDAVHATGFSPTTTLDIGSEVSLYFNYGSISFNTESATDFTSVTSFKRYFEVYVNLDGKTFTHERARMNASGSNLTINGVVPFYGSSELSKLNIAAVSPKLRGYLFGSVNKITLKIDSYSTDTGIYIGYLCSYDGITATKKGPLTSGKFGEITRFYDETNIDYIDLVFDINSTVFIFSNQFLDIQLFPSLSYDEEIMLFASCQLNDLNNKVNLLTDRRQFGNTSEKDLSTSALDYIAAPERLLHANGVIRGLDITIPDATTGRVLVNGGIALVNGKILDINPQTISIPFIKEISGILYNINWALCVNDKGEIVNIPLLDFDAILPTPSNDERLFHAYDVTSGSTYVLDSTKFVDLVVKRKDLVVLYVVAAVVMPATFTTPLSINLTALDARRYVYNETELIGLTWVPKDVDVAGHFKSIEAIITWANKFGKINDVIKVRGEFDFTSSLDLTSISNPIKLLGEGAVFNITAPKGFLVKSNISFDNITFNYNPSEFLSSGNITSEHGCIFADTDVTGGAVSDITVKNCKFNSSTVSHPPYMSFRVNTGAYINNIDILDNTFNDTSDHAAAIAFVGSYTGWTAGQACVIGNINVIDNNCFQDQVFYFVNSYSVAGNSFSIPGLTAVNVKVHNNKFGYLGLNISGNNKYASAVTGKQLFSIDKNQLIAIVGPLDETGKDPSSNPSGIGDATTGPGLPTGNVIISNNEVNYIVTEARGSRATTSDGYVGHLSIHNNNMLADNFVTTVMNPFSIEIATPLSGFANNIAIYIGTRNYTTNSDNDICISIQDNMIEGQKINDSYHGYGAGILAKSPSLITGNIIKGLVNVQASGNDLGFGIRLELSLDIFRPFSKIHYNSIYRFDENILAYVYLFNCQADVTDNFFDSSFVANLNEDVIFQDPILSSNIMRNKNQIVNTYFQGNIGIVGVNQGLQMGSASAGSFFAAVANTYAVRNSGANFDTLDINNHALTIDVGTSSFPFTEWTISMKELLPAGVILVSAAVKAMSTASGATGSSNLSLIVSNLKKGEVVPTTISASSTLGNPYVPNTQITINLDLSPFNFRVNQDDMYNFIRVLVDGSSHTGAMSYSPINVKYKW